MAYGLKVLKKRDDSVGFALAGRRLDPRRLALTAGVSEQVVEVFVPDPKVGFPVDVEAAKMAMVGDSNSFMRLDRRGVGTGYLRFDDVFERPAFILRFDWRDIGTASERSTLAWLFVCAMIFGGIIHASSSGALTWFALQKRHTPGLSGLSDHEFRSTVESFPGYAFALASDGTYVGMSRSLSGVFGKEPSDFYAKTFGEVSGERGFSPRLVTAKLLESKQWPAVESIEIMVQGLEKEHKFSGSVYFISNKQVSLYLVKAKRDDRAESVPFEEFQKMQRSGAAEVMAGIAEELTDTIVDAERTSEEILAHIAHLPADDKRLLSKLTLRLKLATRRVHQVLLAAADRAVGAAHDSEPAKSEQAFSLVQKAIDDVSTYAEAMRVPIELQADDRDLKLTCKARPFIQAVCHLVSNGVDAVAGTETPWVRVHIRRKDDSLELSVTDSGAGLSVEEHDQAFKPFYSTKVSKAQTPHLGLGLSFVQGFAESHSGALVYDKDAAITRFVITLPLNPPALEQFVRTPNAA